MQPTFRKTKNVYVEIKTERTANHENSERANVSTVQAPGDKSKVYSEYVSAKKGYREAYEKGDMKAAKECQEKMDKAIFEAKEKEIEAEQDMIFSKTKSKAEGVEKARN